MNKVEKLSQIVGVGDVWAEDYRFPGYFVSPDGIVATTRGKVAKILKPIRRGKYLGFSLADQTGAIRGVYLHRIVAENFHGPCPDGMECCHTDGNRFNNAATNLRWDTHKANENDKINRVVPCKLTEHDVSEMRRIRHETNASYKSLAERFGVTTMTAYRAINRQSWQGVF